MNLARPAPEFERAIAGELPGDANGGVIVGSIDFFKADKAALRFT